MVSSKYEGVLYVGGWIMGGPAHIHGYQVARFIVLERPMACQILLKSSTSCASTTLCVNRGCAKRRSARARITLNTAKKDHGRIFAFRAETR